MFRLLILKLKEQIYVPFEWLSLFSAIVWAIYLAFFWKFVSELTTILSYEDFLRFNFYYYFFFSFFSIFYGLMFLPSTARSGRLNLYLSHPVNFLIYYLLRELVIPYHDLTICIFFLFLLNFKISLEEILLLLFSASYFVLFISLFIFTSAILESDFVLRIFNLIRNVGQFPTFIYKSKIVNFVLPIAFVGTVPLLLKYFPSLFKELFLFSLITSPIFFAISLYLFKLFLRKYQAYGG